MRNIVKNFQIFVTPSECLKVKSKPLTFPLSEESLEDITYLKSCFKKSLTTSPTLGLSAPQVGINSRFFIVPTNLSYLKHCNSVATMKNMIKSYNVFINPLVLAKEGQEVEAGEYCKSVPYEYTVKRNEKITVSYQNVKGETINKELTGIMARLFQHETDHLDGITIEDIGVKVVEEPNHESNSVENKKEDSNRDQ